MVAPHFTMPREHIMKTFHLAAVAALMLAGSAAHAGSSIAFSVGGHNIRVNAPRHCQSLSCLQVSGVDLDSLKSGIGKGNDDGSSPASTATPAPAVTAGAAIAAALAPQAVKQALPQAVPQTLPQALPQASPQPAVPAPVAPAPIASAAPALPQPAPLAPAPVAPASAVTAAVAAPAAPLAPPAPVAPPAPIAAPAPVAQPAQTASAALESDPNSPLGIWATEQNKGNVRIETCGSNLCGYSAKSGEKILINMRPKESKWVGRIHDPEGGGNYDSTIALKGPNTLKVQGCAFGGLFCGGQTWKRVG
jgi:uncharacterized protein (DUF2147 family)